MTRAVKGGSTHGVGLGRAACAEPDLPDLILSGKVQSGKKTLIDTQNFMETAKAANGQIRQIGRGEEPIDLTDPVTAEMFNEISQKFDKWVLNNMMTGVVAVQGMDFRDRGAMFD